MFWWAVLAIIGTLLVMVSSPLAICIVLLHLATGRLPSIKSLLYGLGPLWLGAALILLAA